GVPQQFTKKAFWHTLRQRSCKNDKRRGRSFFAKNIDEGLYFFCLQWTCVFDQLGNDPCCFINDRGANSCTGLAEDPPSRCPQFGHFRRDFFSVSTSNRGQRH